MQWNHFKSITFSDASTTDDDNDNNNIHNNDSADGEVGLDKEDGDCDPASASESNLISNGRCEF